MIGAAERMAPPPASNSACPSQLLDARRAAAAAGSLLPPLSAFLADQNAQVASLAAAAERALLRIAQRSLRLLADRGEHLSDAEAARLRETILSVVRRGTAGNAANADPATRLAASALASGASLFWRGDGERAVAVCEMLEARRDAVVPPPPAAGGAAAAAAAAAAAEPSGDTAVEILRAMLRDGSLERVVAPNGRHSRHTPPPDAAAAEAAAQATAAEPDGAAVVLRLLGLLLESSLPQQALAVPQRSPLSSLARDALHVVARGALGSAACARVAADLLAHVRRVTELSDAATSQREADVWAVLLSQSQWPSRDALLCAQALLLSAADADPLAAVDSGVLDTLRETGAPPSSLFLLAAVPWRFRSRSDRD